ncbi:MAG: outer membrane protein assembly factor [bacterium]
MNLTKTLIKNCLIIFLSYIILFILPLLAFSQTADSTRQLIIEHIEVTGITKTNRNVIFRYLTLQEGEVINPARVEANYRRLSQTNFFKEVDIYTRPGSAKGKVVVVIEVKERHWPYFQFEGGHSDLNGWYFVPASLRFDNFFGNGNFIGIQWFIGDRVSKLSLGYRNPNLFDDNAFLDIELYAAGHDFIHYFGSSRISQNVNSGGLRIKLGGTEGVFKHIYFAYRIETYEPSFTAKLTDNDSTITFFPSDIADDLQKTNIGVFSLVLHADLRDNPYYPLNGFWGALSGELAHDEVGSEVNFSKITLDTRFYQRVFGRQVFAFHLKTGYTTENAPFYERFYLGGANSLRGYPDRRLTPVGWGSKLILTNTEFRFPLSSKNFPYHKVSGVLFFDAGGIWLSDQTPDLQDFFTSIGFGFRVKLPIMGLTRFDFSFPLNNVDENDFQFHISLGHTF